MSKISENQNSSLFTELTASEAENLSGGLDVYGYKVTFRNPNVTDLITVGVSFFVTGFAGAVTTGIIRTTEVEVSQSDPTLLKHVILEENK